MNNTTFHLMSLLCKSSVSKYMIMAKSVINEIIKKIIILISNYYYEVVVYGFYTSKEVEYIQLHTYGVMVTSQV